MEPAGSNGNRSMLRADRVAGAALALLGLVTVWESRAFPFGSLRNPGPAFVPVVLAVLLIVFGGAIAVLGRSSPSLSRVGWSEGPHAVAIFVACGVAALGLERLGYRVTMAVMLFLLLRVVERKGTLFAAGFAVGMAVATFWLFDTFLRVPLPRGPFGV